MTTAAISQTLGRHIYTYDLFDPDCTDAIEDLYHLYAISMRRDEECSLEDPNTVESSKLLLLLLGLLSVQSEQSEILPLLSFSSTT